MSCYAMARSSIGAAVPSISVGALDLRPKSLVRSCCISRTAPPPQRGSPLARSCHVQSLTNIAAFLLIHSTELPVVHEVMLTSQSPLLCLRVAP